MMIKYYSLLTALATVMLSVTSADVRISARHNEGGTIGPNGIRQVAEFVIYKQKKNLDQAFIKIDLGEHKYPSAKPPALVDSTYVIPQPDGSTKSGYRPTIILKLGAVVIFQGVANTKAELKSENYDGKLLSNGKGLQFKLSKQNLSMLLSELSGVGEHANLTIIIEDNHPPAPTVRDAQPRHAHSLFEKTFELDIEENKNILHAKG